MMFFKRTVISVTLPLILLTQMVLASSASALDPNCYVWANPSYTDGIRAYGTGTIACTHGVRSAHRVQAQVDTRWSFHDSPWFYSSFGPAYNLSTEAWLTCNGTGSQERRTVAKGTDIYGASLWIRSGYTPQTC